MTSPWHHVPSIRDPEDALELVEQLEARPPGEAPAHALALLAELGRVAGARPLVDGWAEEVDPLGLALVVDDPRRLVHAPPAARDLLALRAGLPLVDPDALAHALADRVAAGTLPSSWAERDGPVTLRRDRRLRPEVHARLAAALGAARWHDALRAACARGAGAPTDDLAPVLATLPGPSLAAVLLAAPAQPTPSAAVAAALDAHTPERLAALAEALAPERPDQAERCAVAALRGTPALGARLGPLLSGASVIDPDAGPWWPRLREALAALPPSVRREVGARAIASGDTAGALLVADDAAQVGALLRRAGTLGGAPRRLAILGLAALGPARLPWLVHAADRAPDAATRAVITRAILALLSSVDGPCPDGADHLLDLDVDDPDRATEELRRVLAAMPAARADALLAELLGPHHPRFAQAFALLGPDTGPRAWDAAADALAWEPHRLDAAAIAPVSAGLARVREPLALAEAALTRAVDPARTAVVLHAALPPDAPRALPHPALWPADPAERVARLAEAWFVRAPDDPTVPAWLPPDPDAPDRRETRLPLDALHPPPDPCPLLAAILDALAEASARPGAAHGSERR